MEKSLVKNVVKYWYTPLIIGLLYTVLGVWVLATPFSSFLSLTVLLSIGIALSGALESFYAISNRKNLQNWGWSLAGGILGLVLGLFLFVRPELTALMLSFSIGFWLLFRSIMSISFSVELKGAGSSKWGWVLATGILGILFSLLLLWNPVITGVTIGLWAGFGIITIGILHIILGFFLRRIKKFGEKLEEDMQDYEVVE